MKSLLCAFATMFVICCGRDETTTTATIPPLAEPQTPACVPAARRLCPVDEASLDPSFAAFRSRLLEVVLEKDAAKLVAMMDPGIRTTFGEGGGAEDFRKRWKLSSPDSEVWNELAEVLSLGGSFRGEKERGSFWAPYVFANWPEQFDAFEYVAAIRAGVPLRAKPEDAADEVARVDWEILEVLRDEKPLADTNWLRIRSVDGHEGWVRASDVRSPIDYRAGFSKRSGEWKMEVFVAGD